MYVRMYVCMYVYPEAGLSIVSEKRAFSHLPTPSLGRDAIFLLLWAESKELAPPPPPFFLLHHPSRWYSDFSSSDPPIFFQTRVEKEKLALETLERGGPEFS